MEEQPVRIELTIVNTGASEARIVESCASLDWYELIDIPTPADFHGRDIVPKTIIPPSRTLKVTTETNEHGGLWLAMADREMTQGYRARRLCLLGWVVYTDGRGEEFGTRRTTYFGRFYSVESERFDPDDEFLDWEFIT